MSYEFDGLNQHHRRELSSRSGKINSHATRGIPLNSALVHMNEKRHHKNKLGKSASESDPLEYVTLQPHPLGDLRKSSSKLTGILQKVLAEVLDPIVRNDEGMVKVIRDVHRSVSTKATSNKEAFWEKISSMSQNNRSGEAVKGQKEENIPITSEYRSSLRWQCTNHLACEEARTLEIDNAIFYNGTLYLNNPDQKSLHVIQEIHQIYKSKERHLPPNHHKDGAKLIWKPGPKIVIYDINTSKHDFNKDKMYGTKDIPNSCTSVWDTTAYFHIPWETSNNAHALVDNVLQLLLNLVVQYISDAAKGHTVDRSHRSLFLYKNKFGGTATIFDYLYILFPDNIYKADDIFNSDKIHCFRHITWTRPAKLHSTDGLWKLLRIMQKVVRRINNLAFMPNNNTKLSQNTKIVNISRGKFMTANKYRYLEVTSERALLKSLSKVPNVVVKNCCDWRASKSLASTISLLADADICIGIHGAGLSNCFFGPPGMIVYEIQVPTAVYFGYDFFMKIAHSTGGTHVMYLPGHAEMTENGVALNNYTIADSTDLINNLITKQRKERSLNSISNNADFIVNNVNTTRLSLISSLDFVLGQSKKQTKFIVSEGPFSASEYWMPLDVLGPKGLSNESFDADIIPLYAQPPLYSKLSYQNYCESLPYYKWRIYTRKLRGIPCPECAPCDGKRRIMVK